MGRIIVCSDCGEEKEHHGNGLCHYCYKKKWVNEHKERRGKYNRKYYEKHKEQIKEYRKKYNKKYREEHKEQIKEYRKKWYEKHPCYGFARYHSSFKNQFHEQLRRRLHREKCISNGLCGHCGKNPIDYYRSVCNCNECLDKSITRNRKKSHGGLYELIYPEENTSNEVIKL